MRTDREQDEPASVGTDGGALIAQLWEALERDDLAHAGDLVTDDFVMAWPQSGERFSGRDRAIAAIRAQDEKPEPAGEPRIIGSGDVWVALVPIRYGSVTHQYVGVFELSAGKIARATEVFGAPFPPKEARARFADTA